MRRHEAAGTEPLLVAAGFQRQAADKPEQSEDREVARDLGDASLNWEAWGPWWW
jgi:hypothetical protein